MIEMLRLRRRQQGISLEKLAAPLRVSPYTIGRWERGECSPSIVQFLAWVRALGLRVDLRDPEANRV